MAVSRVAYPARFTVAADGAVAVGFRDLPEALTAGDNLDEALAEAAYAQGVIDEGERRVLKEYEEIRTDVIQVDVFEAEEYHSLKG